MMKTIPAVERILAIETSGSTFSAALAENGMLVSEVFWHSGLTHSERLLPAVKRLLAEAGWETGTLSKIAVSTGPGSFTGIRVGLSCARTLAQALGIPLVGMTSLELLSRAIPEGNYLVYPVIDALRDELFVRGMKSRAPEIVPVAGLALKLGKTRLPVVFVGNGALAYRTRIAKMLKKKALFAPEYLDYPHAGVLALAAHTLKGGAFHAVKPLYIRRSWAEERRK